MKLLSYLMIFAFSSLQVFAADNESLGRTGKKTMVVAKAAMYGAAGGLVVGLASQAFKKKSKNIFLFGSLGLYTGIAMGVYAIMSSRGGGNYEGPDTYGDYMGMIDLTVPQKQQEQLFAEKLDNSTSVSLYSFSF